MVVLTLIDTPAGKRLRVEGGALVLSADAQNPCCCDDCKICFYFSQSDNCQGTTLGNKKYKKTITVPDRFSLPVKVTAVGVVDDVFVLDGDGSVFGQNPNLFGTPAHEFNYEWVQNNRTFTVEALDTFGSCTGITYTICIMPLDTSPTKECEPLTVLPDSNPPP